MTPRTRTALLPALVALVALACSVAGAQPFLPAPATPVSNTFKTKLSSQPNLASYTQLGVLSMRLDISGDPSVRSRLAVRVEPTLVLPKVRQVSPEQSVDAPGLYLAVGDSSNKIYYLVRLGDPRLGLAEFEEAGRLRGVAVQRDGGTIRTRFPYFTDARLSVYEVGPPGTVALKFQIDVDPPPVSGPLAFELVF